MPPGAVSPLPSSCKHSTMQPWVPAVVLVLLYPSKYCTERLKCFIYLLCLLLCIVLPRKSHGWRSLEGCSPWGRWGSDTTERLHFHFSLSCIGEGNGNPLQCSCLENPRDRGACWAAVYGVRLKWLSNSNSNCLCEKYYKPVIVQYYVADRVSWVPRLTLLDLQIELMNMFLEWSFIREVPTIYRTNIHIYIHIYWQTWLLRW